MRTPERLVPLIDQGVIEEVLRPLMSGKEAAVYLVVAEGKICVAKVYKEAQDRSFKNRADYIEGRNQRNSRSQRAMQKRSKFGREEIEAAWRSAEVDAIYRLRDAGVRVPEPYAFVDGVLVMELITGPDGEPAPRLVDLTLTAEEATELFQQVLREVVRMLCAGIVHGDLSDFNVLLGVDGPVVIDFPQAVDPATNLSARKLLVRDVQNLTSFLARHAPDLKKTKYGEEMWQLYERNELHPESKLTGRFKGDDRKADTRSLLQEIEEVEREAMKRREALGLPPMRPARQPILPSGPPPKPISEQPRRGERRPEPAKGGRDQGGDRREFGGDRRDSGGDRREFGGDRRDSGGDRRDSGGDRREFGGDRRDSGGDRRDGGRDRREPVGDRRDPGGDRREPGRGSPPPVEPRFGAGEDGPGGKRKRRRKKRGGGEGGGPGGSEFGDLPPEVDAPMQEIDDLDDLLVFGD
jgi:RIO kinase 1